MAEICPKYDFITTEVSPQHLFLAAPGCYDRLKTFAQINPPIRAERHGVALRNALKQGVIACMGTDHAPHTIEEKKQPYPTAPSGMPGIETWLPLMLTWAKQGQCTLHDIWRWCSLNTTALFNIENKGQLKAGFDADLVMIDLDQHYKIDNAKQFTKAKWSAFDGIEVVGKPLIVYREGDIFTDVKGKEVRVL